MNSAYVYLQLYKLFDDVTPLEVDCGKLCGGACCRGDDCGMYLFPGEKKVFDLLEPDWISIEKSDFKYTYNKKEKNLYIAFCTGKCERYQRPLACRIFPLTPILTEKGRMDIIIDPRSKSVCPLGKTLKLNEYSNKFLNNLKKTFSLLNKNPEFHEFMKVYSDYLRDFQKFI